jgi:hypothetical protein
LPVVVLSSSYLFAVIALLPVDRPWYRDEATGLCRFARPEPPNQAVENARIRRGRGARGARRRTFDQRERAAARPQSTILSSCPATGCLSG